MVAKRCSYLRCALSILVTVACLSHVPSVVAAKTVQEKLDAHQFPKLWNDLEIGDLRWLFWTNKDPSSPAQPGADLEMIPMWDVISLDVEATENSPSLLAALRSANPDLVVLSYWTSLAMEIAAFDCWGENEVRCNFAPLIEAGDWFVLDTAGNRVYAWTHERLSSAFLMDVTSDWQTEVPAYLDSRAMATGLWDGVFYDWTEDDIAWLNDQIPNPIDLNRDGVAEDDAYLDGVFLTGRRALFQNSQSVWAPNLVLVGNAGWTGHATVYNDVLNGMMIEDFTYAESQWPEGFGWTAVMRKLAEMLSSAMSPTLCAIQMSGRWDDYRAMRFGLCSALMLGCYYAYDGNRSCGAYDPSNSFANACGHHHTWWYDEYSVNSDGWPSGDGSCKGYLGAPLGPAYAAGNPAILLPTALATGTPDPPSNAWRRDFEHGVVLVNPSPGTAFVNPNSSCAKIHGSRTRGQTTEPALLRSRFRLGMGWSCSQA